jgi:hypothetical protein
MIKYIFPIIIFSYLFINTNYELSSILYIIYLILLFLMTFPISLIFLIIYIALYLLNNIF